MLTSPQAILYRKTANLLTGDAYRAPPILLSMGTCMVFLVIIGGYVQVHLTIPWLIANITLLGLALIGSVLPTSIVFLSQADEADTLKFTLDYLLRNHRSVHQHLHHRDEISCKKTVPQSNALHNHASNKRYRFRWAILFFSMMFLVILSGDVELNPGPLVRVSLTVENVARKLKAIECNSEQLKLLGVWLNTPSSERTTLHRLLTYFIEMHPFGSWRTVIWALDAIKEHSIADKIRNYAERIEDETLNTEAVANVVLKTTKGWYGAFADSMGIPWTIQERIKNDFSTVDKQKRALMKYWVETLHDAAWTTLAGVLYQTEENSALSDALKYLKEDREETLTIVNLLHLLGDVDDLDCDKFAYFLDMPWSNRIRLSKKCKQQPSPYWLTALMSEWLISHPAPTWRLVANALSWMGRKNRKLHQALKTIYKSEKFLPDPESKRLCTVLNKAWKEGGKLEQMIVQLHLSGTTRSGKTSLIRRLTGKHARKDEPSTGVADKPVRVDISKTSMIVENTDDAGLWREIRDINEESTLILTSMRENMSKIDTAETEYQYVVVPSFLQPVDSEHRAPPGLQPQENSLASSVNPIEVFEHAIDNSKEEIRHTKDPLSIYITDIGGQHEFQELIPALVSGPSVFLIVVPAHWGLSNIFPVTDLNRDETISSQESQSDYQCNGMTLKEYVLQSIATIMCVRNREMASVCPKLLFVLTFKDQIKVDELAAVDRELRDAVCLTEAYNLNMIEFASQDFLCHSINNLSEDDTDVKQIQRTIERIARRNEGYHVQTPYSWQFFGITLRSLPDNIIDYNTCLEIGARCGISSREDLDSALIHFHEQTGVLRYYHNVPELQEIIFLNPQVLFDKVSTLFTNLFTFHQVGKHESDRFCRKGIFSLKTLEKIMAVSPVDFFTATRLVAFLKHYHIIAPLRDSESTFFLPCILARANLVATPPSWSIVEPLLMSFKNGYTPRGLFGFMITHLLEVDTTSDFNMEIANNSDQIYRNQISLIIHPFGDIVKFSLHASYIRIDITQLLLKRTVPINCICCHVKNRVIRILEQIRLQFHYNIDTNEVLAFICPHLDKNEHAAFVKSLKNEPVALQCSLLNQPQDLPSGWDMWFSDKSQDLTPTLSQLKLLTSKNNEKVEIIKVVASKWEHIGVLMDFDSTGSYLDLVKKRCGERSPEECCIALFQHWLRGNGKPSCTWGTVTEFLKDIGYPTLALNVNDIVRQF